eukprot:COSAG02_NODE_1534_length_12054_cov_22.784442_4_plen_60_part_00
MLNLHTDLRSRLHRTHRRAKIVLSDVRLQLIKRPVVFIWRHRQPMTCTRNSFTYISRKG